MRRRVWLALAALLALLAYLRLGDPFGDRGMSNVFSMLAVALALLVLVLVRLWRGAWRERLAWLGSLTLALVAFLALVRVEGVSGEMLPRLAWRAAPRPVLPAPPAARVLTLAPPDAQDFAAFLGPRRDNAAPLARLARDWGAAPPRLRWRAPIGAGWSAFAVSGGWAFTLEQDGAAQRVSARDVASGQLGWSVAIDEPFLHVLGGDGPRATPCVDEGRVYAHSAWGKLVCLDAASGEVLWSHDLLAEQGLTRAAEGELAQYGRSSSPLVSAELVIVPVGGPASGPRAGLVAFDKRSGERRWEGPPRHFSYSSPVLASLGGDPQVLVVNEESLSGHALADGRLLWEHPWPGRTSGDANVSQVVPLEGQRLFVSKGYGGGAALLALEPAADGRFTPRVQWHEKRLLRTKLTNVVVHAGFVYGLDDGVLECVELASGAKRWKAGRYGHGQILLAGELLLVCSEEGEVFLLEPDPQRENAVLGRFQGLSGKSWAHLALAQGVLFLRNASECAAWELPRAE